MQYLGGKAKIARHIVNAILDDAESRDVWFEPFVGGANVLEKAAPYFGRCYAADAHPDLIMMWEHVTAGGMLPDYVSPEKYRELRHAEPSALRGFVGFGASFGGKWFAGYGGERGTADAPRDATCRASHRTVSRQAGVFSRWGVRFRCANFGTITPPDGAVVYCDPPYLSTTAYSTGAFDHDKFYETLIDWAGTRAVYVSGYAIPDDVPHTLIWTGERRTSVKKDDNATVRTENLYRVRKA